MTRLELHEKLCNLLGSRYVYFQPPESVKMNYPAIVYSMSDIHNTYADDSAYTTIKEYLLTIIDKDPDSEIPNKFCELPYCAFDRHYVTDNLNHYVFTIKI